MKNQPIALLSALLLLALGTAWLSTSTVVWGPPPDSAQTTSPAIQSKSHRSPPVSLAEFPLDDQSQPAQNERQATHARVATTELTAGLLTDSPASVGASAENPNPPWGTLRGTVIRADTGEPLPDVRIFLSTCIFQISLDDHSTTSTDQLGAFMLPIPREDDYVIYVYADGYRLPGENTHDLTLAIYQPDTSITIAMISCGGFRGLLVDAGGEPLTDHFVKVSVCSTGYSLCSDLRTNAQGEWSIDFDSLIGMNTWATYISEPGEDPMDLPQNFRLRLIPDCFAPIVLECELLSESTILHFGKCIARPGQPLRGRVINAWGDPVAHAKVKLNIDAGLSAISCKTDNDGWFERPHLAGESAWIEIDADGYQPFVIRTETGDRLLEPLVLRDGLTATGRLITAAGAPLFNYGVTASFTVSNAGASRYCLIRSLTDRDGKYELHGLPHDWVEIHVDTLDYQNPYACRPEESYWHCRPLSMLAPESDSAPSNRDKLGFDNVDFILQRAVQIGFRLRDRDSGAIIKPASPTRFMMETEYTRSDDRREIHTRCTGNYPNAFFLPGKADFTIHVEGYRPCIVNTMISDSPLTQTLELALEMEPR